MRARSCSLTAATISLLLAALLTAADDDSTLVHWVFDGKYLTDKALRPAAGSVALPGSTTVGYQGVGWADFSPDGAHWLIQPSASDTSLVTVDSQFLASPAEVAYPPFIHANGSYPLHGKWVFYDGSGARKIVVAQADAAANALFDFTVLVE